MRILFALALAGCGGSTVEASWSTHSIDTLAPKDARFELGCANACGKRGRDRAVAIDVTFGKKYDRRLSICCGQRDEVLARLVTVHDMWCSGLAVPPKQYGDLTVGTTRSELSGKRAATLDQGEGYVAFQCDDWLPKLIDGLAHADCCASAP